MAVRRAAVAGPRWQFSSPLLFLLSPPARSALHAGKPRPGVPVRVQNAGMPGRAAPYQPPVESRVAGAPGLARSVAGDSRRSRDGAGSADGNEAHDGVAMLHKLALEHALREETQAVRALPVAASVGDDDAHTPAMRQPDTKPEPLLFAMRKRQPAGPVQVQDADGFAVMRAVLPEPRDGNAACRRRAADVLDGKRGEQQVGGIIELRRAAEADGRPGALHRGMFEQSEPLLKASP